MLVTLRIDVILSMSLLFVLIYFIVTVTTCHCYCTFILYNLYYAMHDYAYKYYMK